MKKLSIFLTIALMAIIYSCGNGKQSSNEQKVDSLATAEKSNNEADIKQAEPQITLTVKSGKSIRFEFRSFTFGEDTKIPIPVRIASGNRDTTFELKDFNLIDYTTDGTKVTIYGKVKDFSCDDNYETVTAIDISNNKFLEKLSCRRNNIKELNVSGNKALKRIDCCGSTISSLDLSNCPELNYLSCPLTKISSLDLSKNPVLEGVMCGNEGLNIVDFSNNKVLRSLSWTGNLTADNLSKIIESLTDRTGLELKGEFEVTQDVFEHVLTPEQKKQAKNKNWEIYYEEETGLM